MVGRLTDVKLEAVSSGFKETAERFNKWSSDQYRFRGHIQEAVKYLSNREFYILADIMSGDSSFQEHMDHDLEMAEYHLKAAMRIHRHYDGTENQLKAHYLREKSRYLKIMLGKLMSVEDDIEKGEE